MRKLLISGIIAVILMFLWGGLCAVVKVKTQGSISTKNKKPKAEEKQTAIRNGQELALQKYIAGLDSRRVQILNSLMPTLLQDLDKYLLGTQQLSDGEYTNGIWSINLEVSVNDAQIEQLVSSSLAANPGTAGELYISFVYVAREAEPTDVNSFRGFSPAGIDARVTEVFNKANFEVVPAYEASILPEQFAYDFAYLGEISSSTQKEATDQAKEAGLDFLAVATLDVGSPQIDPVTGTYKVYVSVTGSILDLRKKFALVSCSVGPVQYSGLGENPTVAKTNALISASTKASQDLVDQFRVKLGL
jgi:hypothetical protein